MILSPPLLLEPTLVICDFIFIQEICLYMLLIQLFVLLPGCPLCQAAAGAWRCECVPSSGRGRRARSGCCLRRDAAAGSSAPQQTACAPGRHGKNWSWTPLRGERQRDREREGGGGGGGEKTRGDKQEEKNWLTITLYGHCLRGWKTCCL